MAGMSLHTWTGWGSVVHWNAFVANLEMMGKGTFYDPRLNDAHEVPAGGAGRLRQRAQDARPDHVEARGPALLPAGPARPGTAGRQLRCRASPTAARWCSTARPAAPNATCRRSSPSRAGRCTRRPRSASTISRRSARRTAATGPHRWPGCWTHSKGGFYHDGRFATLQAVVDHYDGHFNLQLTAGEKNDLVEYLKSL